MTINRVRIVSVVVVVALFAAACGGTEADKAATDSRPPRTVRPPAGVADMTLAATVAALSGPATAERGVWSLLAHIGVGVYTPSGEPVQPGSERGPGDLWLYDFEIPPLAAMAIAPPQPLSAHAAALGGAAATADTAALVIAVAESSKKNPDDYLAQLLAAMTVDFATNGPSTPVSPLVWWLVVLAVSGSAASPRPPAVAATPTTPSAPAAVSKGEQVVAASAQSDPCATIGGSSTAGDPGVGPVVVPPEWAFLLGESYVRVHSLLLEQGLTVTPIIEPAKVHEGHDDTGESTQLGVRVDVRFEAVPVATACGQLLGWVPPVAGPRPGADISLALGSFLAEHGSLTAAVIGTTDRDGRFTAPYQARIEPDDAVRDDEHLIALPGEAIATVDLTDAMANIGLPLPFTMLLPRRRVPITVNVEWHGRDVEVWNLQFRAEHSIPVSGCPPITWTAAFAVTVDGNRATGSGTATPAPSGPPCGAQSGPLVVTGTRTATEFVLSSEAFVFGSGVHIAITAPGRAEGTVAFEDAYNHATGTVTLVCQNC